MSLKEFINNNLIIESGFSRLMQIMSGLVPKVKNFAIITWENPMNISLSKKENEQRNLKLKELLINGAYVFKQIQGKYNTFENPYFIFNITKDEAFNLGVQGKQETIIHADIKGEFDIIFKLIYCFSDVVLTRHVWKSTEADNFYSKYKGRKFNIPFFDDNLEKAKFDKGKIIIQNSNKIYYQKDFSQEILTEIEAIDLLNEFDSGKHRWLMRGLVSHKLNEFLKNKEK